VKIAHVSTFPKLRCGIARYAADLIAALPHIENVKYALHYGANLSDDSALDADVSDAGALRLLAKKISNSDCDVVSLQHEFGIWGGRLGENIICFLDELSKPVVSTLHTTFDLSTRDSLQTAILKRLIGQSSRVVVLTEMSKQMASRLLGDDTTEKIVVIPHGVPDAPFVPAPRIWPLDYSPGARRRALSLVSLGFFRRDKGLESVLVALWMLKRRGLRFSYLMAGEPQRQFAGQEEYLHEIQDLISALGLQEDVRVLHAFNCVRTNTSRSKLPRWRLRLSGSTPLIERHDSSRAIRWPTRDLYAV
jgi:glycosyltransferase involved in cell wall biosynthesis